MTSVHYRDKRFRREKIIKKIGEGEVYDEFVVDRHHKDGTERHVITTTGIIIIYNLKTNRLVTKLIAREAQIKRYYHGDAPWQLVALAFLHEQKHYNEI